MSEETSTSAAQPHLVRAVSRWQIVGLSINDVIGSGIYLLPAAAAVLLGMRGAGLAWRAARHRPGPAPGRTRGQCLCQRR